MSQVHICNFVTGGPWLYMGFYFEFHEICGPTPLNAKGDPTNRRPSREFWRMWDTFSKLDTYEKQRYEVRKPLPAAGQR